MYARNEAVLDLVTIGRTSVDLYGDQIGSRLEDMCSFSKYVGGSPTNIAIGAARLGLDTANITRVGDDPLGRFIIETLDAEGIDTSQIVSDSKRSTSAVTLGINDKDKCTLVYFRDNCADLFFKEEEINPDFIASARATLISGTMFYNEACSAAAHKAIRSAVAAGRQVILDVDYRPVFLGIRNVEESRYWSEVMKPVLKDLDLIVGTEEEIGVLAGVEGNEKAVQHLQTLTNATIVLKRGEQGCIVYSPKSPDNDETGITGQGFSVTVCNVFGAGDAFMGGFLRGWLRHEPIETCVTWGNACGAMVVSRHGCSPESPTMPELKTFIEQKSRPPQKDDEETLNHIHWATTRKDRHEEVKCLAIDHQWQFEKWARESNKGIAEIRHFKSLLFSAASKVLAVKKNLGLLVDDLYCEQFIPRIDPRSWFVARRTEVHNVTPLRFLEGPAISSTLRTWPRQHVAKMLVYDHETDEQSLREKQLQAAVTLYQSARKTRRTLMLEPVPTPGKPVDERSTAMIMERLYAAGIKPDWWKIEPPKSAKGWDHLVRVVSEWDPYCLGFLLLGKHAGPEELAKAITMGREVDLCKGFVIGRPIFKQAAEDWFSGQIDDPAVISQVYNNYCNIIDLWDSAKTGK